MRLYPAAILLLTAAASLGGCSQSWSGLLPGLADPHLDSPFGFHPASVGQAPAVSFREAQEIGVRWHRPVVYAFWSLVQPDRTRPHYDWGLLDSQYGSVPVGINILANVEVEPRPNPAGYSLPNSYLPADAAAYQAFVRAVVERYDGDGVDDMPGLAVPVRFWQVSNEISGRLDGFAALQRMTHIAIKEACPGCRVVIGGVGGMPEQYPQNFYGVYLPILQTLAGQYMDVFDFHWYGNATGDYRRMREALAVIRAGLQQTGFATAEIWVTEMGTYSGSPSGPLRAWPSQTEAQQASDLFKRFVYSLALGVRKIFPAFGLMEGFKHDGGYFDHTGLIYDGLGSGDLGRGVRKLGYYTHRLMTERLEGSNWTAVDMVSEDPVNGTYVYRFTRGSTPVYVAWWDYFGDAAYSPGRTREITITGLQGSAALIIEVVPMHELGRDVTNYATAFRTDTRTITDGRVTVALGERPVLVEVLR